MKYIMVTNWGNHWDKIPSNLTLYTESMFRNGMSKDKLNNGTKTIFVKKDRETKKIEKSWQGKVYDINSKQYKNSPAVSFRVEIEKEIACPQKYLDYSEGWYCDSSISSERSIVKSSSDVDLIKELKKKPGKWWQNIKEDFDVDKRALGKKINFIKSAFSREIIFRDIEQAYVLMKMGFHKPAVILAGSVIEELLRQYLIYKKIRVKDNRFEEYISCCEKHKLLKSAINSLTTAARHFRNLVHLQKEASKKYSISKATATAAVASIFTIINDF